MASRPTSAHARRRRRRSSPAPRTYGTLMERPVDATGSPRHTLGGRGALRRHPPGQPAGAAAPAGRRRAARGRADRLPDRLRLRPGLPDRQPRGPRPDPAHPRPRRAAPLHAGLQGLQPARAAGARGQRGVPRDPGRDARALHVHPPGHARGAAAAAAPQEAHGRRTDPRPHRGPRAPGPARRAPAVEHADPARRDRAADARAGTSRRSSTTPSTWSSRPARRRPSRPPSSTGRRARPRCCGTAPATRAASSPRRSRDAARVGARELVADRQADQARGVPDAEGDRVVGEAGDHRLDQAVAVAGDRDPVGDRRRARRPPA